MSPEAEIAALWRERADLASKLEVARLQALTPPLVFETKDAQSPPAVATWGVVGPESVVAPVVLIDQQTMADVAQRAMPPPSPESPEALEGQIRKIDERIIELVARSAIEAQFPNQEKFVAFYKEVVDTLKGLNDLADKIKAGEGDPPILPEAVHKAQEQNAEVLHPMTDHGSGEQIYAANPTDYLGSAVIIVTRLAQMGQALYKDLTRTDGPEQDIPADKAMSDPTKAIETSEPTKAVAELAAKQAEAVAELAAKQAKAQQELKAQTDALTAKNLSEHPDESDKQRAARQAALENAAKVAQEALQRQHDAEMQRVMQLQHDERHRT